MAPEPSTAPPTLRADAERNRRRILDAARAVFAEHGLGAGVDVVAREAGVGVGTLYRRFPTKEDLLLAIVDDRLELLAEALDGLRGIDGPWEAFAAATEALASAIARDRAFFQVLNESGDTLPAHEGAKRRTLEALGPFLERAQAAGVVRGDVVVRDIPALCAVAARLPRWRLAAQPDLWRRYLAVVLDGLRPDGASALPHPPPLPARP